MVVMVGDLGRTPEDGRLNPHPVSSRAEAALSLAAAEPWVVGATPAAGPTAAPAAASNGCGMDKGTGLASSLLPREVASSGDFGQFAPEDILKGQNFLEPRAQVGFPETVGGALRNANQQIRKDPPNPKDPFVWNNSTIVPDTMQRGLCA